ncbi:hypothetical protein HanRHA438_Chr17g0793971 [Helianthus annuus]|nr:hypothetical protein HanRHA438_Chr17g0793971 [Helianthus annuus]
MFYHLPDCHRYIIYQIFTLKTLNLNLKKLSISNDRIAHQFFYRRSRKHFGQASPESIELQFKIKGQ